MGHRTLAFVFGVATALSAQLAVALGLGEIKLNSTLNQPLDAKIQLLQVRDLSEREILVGLASVEDFRRIGVERPFFLSDLDFDVDLSDPQNPVVHVTSEKPVREPFLNFVVQAQWPSGRLLREYTLLMDLPVFADERQAQPVQPAPQSSRQASQQPQEASAPRRESGAAQQQAGGQTEPAAGGTRYGPVKASDTLWDIAAAVRPDDVSVQQAMIAIQRANPGAFINNNINLLREGQVLRIPSRSEMAALTTREAISEVAYQNQNWNNRPSAEATGAQLEGSQSYSRDDAEPTQPEGRLNLASPEDVSGSAEGRGTGAGGGNTEALENELNATLEELDRAESENAALKSRIEALEEQISTMERLVDVSSEEMRALQLAAQQADQQAEESDAAGALDGAAEPPAADATEDASQGTDELTPVGPQMAGESEAQLTEAPSAEAETAETEAGAQQVEPPVDPTRVVAPAPQQEKSWLDLLMENIIFIGLGLVAVLVAIMVFLRRRKQQESEHAADDFLLEPDSPYVGDEPLDNDQEEEDWQPEEQQAETDGALFAEDEEGHTEQETEDAVAEAEIYIALAKYDQAEEILLGALEQTPEDTGIRLKLLELYAAQQDLERFDPHYARLRALGDDEAINRAEELREKFTDAPAFEDSHHDTSGFTAALGGAAAGGLASAVATRGTEGGVEESDEELDFTFEDGDQYPDAVDENLLLDEEINNSLNATNNSDEAEDEFDLDLDLGDGDESENEPVTLVDQADDIEFDFDLDLDEEAAANESADTSAEEQDISDEFSIELGAEDTDEDLTEDATLVRPVVQETEDDFVFDFDLDSDEAASDSQADLNEQLESELEASQVVEAPTEEPDDGSVEWDLDSAESPTEAVEKSFESASELHTDEDDQDDDLNLDAEMDLSALDQELDEMTSDFDLGDESARPVEEPSAAQEEPSAGQEEPSAGQEEPSAPEQEPSAPGEEPSAPREEPSAALEEPSAPGQQPSAEDTGVSLEEEPFAQPEEPADEIAPEQDTVEGVMEEPQTDFDDLDTLMQTAEESVEPPAWQQDLESLQASEEPSAGQEEPSAGQEEPSAGQGAPSAPEEELSAPEVAPSEATEDFAVEAEPATEQAAPPAEENPLRAEASEADEATAAFDEFADFDLDDIDPEAEGDEDLAFLSDSDETATKLDLARAYIDMGDRDGAKDILDEIMQEGDDDQRKEAQSLLERV